MNNSLNGWPAITNATSDKLRTITIPGTKRKITVQKDCAPLFAAYLSDWQRQMPARLKLDPGPTAGWNYRQARSGAGLSNHSSGTAVDVLWTTVLPADNKPHMTDYEKAILNDILSRYVTDDGHRVLANGEWWDAADGMHTEISQGWDRGCKRNTTLADVHNVINRLGIDENGIHNLPLWDGVLPSYDNIIYSQDNNVANSAAWRLASRLADLGFFKGTPVNGAQKYPLNAVKAWQQSIGATATGKFGPVAYDRIFPGDQSNTQ